MKNTHDYLRERLLRSVRLPRDKRCAIGHVESRSWCGWCRRLDPREIAEHQVDWEFLEGMVQRLVMGWFRYGDNRDPSLPRHDHVKRIRDCCDLYEQTGNQEALIDIANMALLEKMKAPIGRGTLPPERLHFTTVDDGLHTDELAK